MPKLDARAKAAERVKKMAAKKAGIEQPDESVAATAADSSDSKSNVEVGIFYVPILFIIVLLAFLF